MCTEAFQLKDLDSRVQRQCPTCESNPQPFGSQAQ
uniref:Uncharacterized protein n=1 Tax=Anguilla anguilla TaxID=7936 RepID=A0A0E9XR14_ANGAN